VRKAFQTDLHSPEGHHELDVSKAHAEGEIQPYALRDDLLGKVMAAIWSAGTQPGSHAVHS
jgi:hypothetical protein